MITHARWRPRAIVGIIFPRCRHSPFWVIYTQSSELVIS